MQTEQLREASMLGTGVAPDNGRTVGGLSAASWTAQPFSYSYSVDRLTLQWSQVRVEAVDSHLRRERDGGEQAVVRACVYLGTLLPADVRVELLTGPREPGGMRNVDCPLWSEQSYENGVFVFSASVPASTIERAAGFGVRVTPRSAREGAAELAAVIQWVEPPHTAWWGAPTADLPPREA